MPARRNRRKKRRIKAYLTRLIFCLLLVTLIGLIIFASVKTVNYIKARTDSSVDRTTVYVMKSGKIKETIVEDFDENTYSQSELQKMIDDEVAAYGDGVRAGKLKIKEQKAVLAMAYDNANDYSSFNDETLYADTIDDLVTRGVKFDADALSAGGHNAVVLGISADVVVPAEIIYTSSNTVINSDNHKKATVSANDGELAYIIY